MEKRDTPWETKNTKLCPAAFNRLISSGFSMSMQTPRGPEILKKHLKQSCTVYRYTSKYLLRRYDWTLLAPTPNIFSEGLGYVVCASCLSLQVDPTPWPGLSELFQELLVHIRLQDVLLSVRQNLYPVQQYYMFKKPRTDGLFELMVLYIFILFVATT